jgi:D-alanine transaminase
VNGTIVPADEARVSADDRAHYFGDGVYEVVHVAGGKLWLMAEHMARFQRSLDGLGIGPYDLDAIAAQIQDLVRTSALTDATVYWHMTRGVAPRDHGWPADIQPNLFACVRAFNPKTENHAAGVRAITQPDLRWKRCDIKSLNLLPNVLAKQAARKAGAYEAILVDDRGLVTEGTSTSCVIVREGTLVAPPNGPHILPGITRAKLFQLARSNGIPVEEEFFTVAEMLGADEVFLSGTTTEATPVTHIDDTPVADAAPGPLTRRMHELYCQAMHDELGIPYPVS